MQDRSQDLLDEEVDDCIIEEFVGIETGKIAGKNLNRRFPALARIEGFQSLYQPLEHLAKAVLKHSPTKDFHDAKTDEDILGTCKDNI